MNKKLFILDDDLSTQKILSHSLRLEYDLTQCCTMDEAHKKIHSNQFDMFILDRQLPDGDGLDFCKFLKSTDEFNLTPVLFLSSAVTENDKVVALYSGGNDYISKPFSMLELKARIAVHFRNYVRKLFLACLEIDLDSMTVNFKHDTTKLLNLTPIEFKLLVHFVKNRNKVVSRQELLNRIWGQNLNVTDRVVDTHISHLRRKIGLAQIYLESYRGEGYKLIEN